MNQNNLRQTMAHAFEHLGALLGQGVSLVKAMQTVAMQMEPSQQDIMSVAATLVRTGDGCAQSLERLGMFPGDFIAAINEAETSGQLDLVLIDLARDLAAGDIPVREPVALEALKETLDTAYTDVLKVANRLIIRAVDARASDLHLEPLLTG